MTVGELFAGIGGIGLGLERAGMTVKWAIENNKYAAGIYRKHFPSVNLLEKDIRYVEPGSLETIDLVCGGDPCPSRSLAKGDRQANSPDLAGYFLSMVGRLQPEWVVRENVPAPDAIHFAIGLELLGYGITVIALDSRDFTRQSRRRHFIVGCPPKIRPRFARIVFDAADGFGFSASSSQETTPIAACITAHPSRMAAEDTYVYEPGKGLRTLAPEEVESLQGFPRGWTKGLSRSRRRILLGNAVTVPVAEWIGRRIMEVYGD